MLGLLDIFLNPELCSIREGESSSTIISNTNYFQVHISDGDNVAVLKKQLDFSPLSENEFTIQTDYKGQTYTISLDKFVADAQPQIIESEKGQPLLELVIASEDSGRETLFYVREKLKQ